MRKTFFMALCLALSFVLSACGGGNAGLDSPRTVDDSPPVLAVSDVLAIARYADRTCLVVRQGAGERRGLRKAADLIRTAGGNLVGFVWNEMSFRDDGNPAAEPVVPFSQPALSAPGVTVSASPPAVDDEPGQSSSSPIA